MYIAVRRLDDANAALRSRPKLDGECEEVVMAEGLGDERRQTARRTEGHRRTRSQAGGHHAPYDE